MDIPLEVALNQVKKIYPPTQKWPETREPNGGVIRIQLQRPDCRTFPIGVDRMSLDLLEGRVTRVKAVFDVGQTRLEPLQGLVARLSQQYGAPQRDQTGYRWQDKHTLLRAFDEALPLPAGKGVELRTATELVDLDAYRNFGR